MIKKFGKVFIDVKEIIQIPEMICKSDINNIYTICMWVWNKDRDNISRVTIDSICVGNISKSRMKGESHQHATLKRDSANWLKANGHNNVEFEKGYPGGIADVRCNENKIAIECGWTDTDKIICGISNGWTVGWLCYKISMIAKDHHAVFPIMLFNAEKGIKLDSIFRIMTENEIDAMFADFIRTKPWREGARDNQGNVWRMKGI